MSGYVIPGSSACSADGDFSLAGGESCQAFGLGSVSIGSYCIAWAPYADVAGHTNEVGIEDGEAPDDGRAGFARGINMKVTGNYAGGIGQACRIRARTSFCQGEDNETTTRAESGFAANHFNTIDARAASAFGSNNLATGDGERGLAHGFSAKVIRPTQRAHASGGFTPHSNSESMHHTYAAGDVQDCDVVMRGATQGLVENEGAAYPADFGVPGLAYGPSAGNWLFVLEDDHTYYLRAKLIADGVVIDSEEVETLTSCVFEARATVRCVNGVATIIRQSGQSPILCEDGAQDWSFEFQTYGNGVTLIFLTGCTRARIRIGGPLRFVEIATARVDVAGDGFDMELLEIINPE